LIQSGGQEAAVQRVGIVVGENSGDLLGAGLLKALKQRFPDCLFEGVGGPRMLEEGFTSLYQMERLAVMGFVDPLKRLPELLAMRKGLINHFLQSPPDVFIGIDAPDFNLTIEEKLRSNSIPTVHYVSPSVWAWRQGRIKKIARAVDLMLTLFPFEARFYRENRVKVACVGHTLADQIPMRVDTEEARRSLGLSTAAGERVVAVLPGSRASEIKYLGRLFLQAANLCAEREPSLRFIIAAASEQRKAEIENCLGEFPNLAVQIFLKKSHEVMASADVILLASGTTTLEAMLLKKPMVICYKLAGWVFAIVKRIVKVGHVGLPNLLAGKSVVPELLQERATAENMASQILNYLDNPQQVEALQQEFEKIHSDLKKNADNAAADAICALLAERRGKISVAS